MVGAIPRSPVRLDQRRAKITHGAKGEIGVAGFPSELQRLTGTALGDVWVRLVVGEVRPASRTHRRINVSRNSETTSAARAAQPRAAASFAQAHTEREARIDRSEHSLPRI